MPDILYVDRGGEQVYQSPFSALKVDYYGFLIKADPAAIQRSVCDHCLNDPSGGSEDFVVAMPYVLLAFNNLPDLFSINPPWNDRGHFRKWKARSGFCCWTKNASGCSGTSPIFLLTAPMP